MITQSPRLEVLDQRRKQLGMSRSALARRAGISLPTVTRILTGEERSPALSSLQAIASALAVEIRLGSETQVVPVIDDNQMRTARAREIARRLVGMVQANMSLEGQAVEADTLEAMVEQTVHELLAGSPRALWDD